MVKEFLSIRYYDVHNTWVSVIVACSSVQELVEETSEDNLPTIAENSCAAVEAPHKLKKFSHLNFSKPSIKEVRSSIVEASWTALKIKRRHSSRTPVETIL